MTLKKQKTPTDQINHTHRDEYKHSRTKKHYIEKLKEEDAMEQVKTYKIPPCSGHGYE